MPPKRSTRAAAAATKPATQTRTTRAGPPAAPSPAAKAAVAAARTATTTSKTAAPSRKTKKAPVSAAPPQQLDGAADDDDIETSNGSASADNDSGADDSDTLAISNWPARLFRRANRDTAADNDGNSKAEDYVMAGALGEGDVAGAHVAAMQKKSGGRNVRTRGRMRGAGTGGVTKQRTAARDPEQARALEALRRRREEAMGGAVAVEPAAVAEREEEDKERGRKQEVPGTASRVRRASSSHWSNAIPGSAVKAQGTPAAERSVLALTKFQKRRRQGSLLRMMQQSDAEDNTDGDSGDVDDSAATLDYSLGDFEPDHESTPLNLGRKGSIAAALPGSDPRTSSSRKRKLAEREETEEISMVQVPRSSPPPAVEDQEVADGEETSSEHLYSEASELPEAIADTQPEAEEAAADKTVTESIAPPRSTSPLSSLPAEPEPEEMPAKRPRRAAARPATSYSRTSQRVSNVDTEDHGADPLSTSELESDTATETPARTRTSRKKPNTRKVKALPLSTATLQSLLPRRRKKLTTRAAKIAAGGTFEIPSSSDAEEEIEQESADEDELQRPSAAAKRGRGRKNVAAKASDSTVRANKKQSAAAKEKNKKRLSRTYGRRSSDKENQDAADTSMYVRSGGESDGDDDDNDVVETSEMREMKRSKELEAAARKFKEVDDWEMEFESVDMGGGGGASASSPWR